MRGVSDLTVEHDDVGARGQSRDGGAKGAAGGHHVPECKARPVDYGVGHRRDRWRVGSWMSRRDVHVAHTAECGDGALGHLRRERLTVPAVLVFQLCYALGLDGPSQDHARAIRVRSGVAQCLVDRREIVTIDDQCSGTKGLNSARVALKVPLEFSGSSLAQPIDVDNGRHVAQRIKAGLVERFPH